MREDRRGCGAGALQQGAQGTGAWSEHRGWGGGQGLVILEGSSDSPTAVGTPGGPCAGRGHCLASGFWQIPPAAGGE